MSATNRGAQRVDGQTSFFDPLPCRVCGEPATIHWLPNHDPPEWVAANRPKCGPNIYAPTREAVVVEWNAAQMTPTIEAKGAV